MSREFSFETLQLHAGQTPDKETKSRAVPIYQTTSYVFDDAQEGEDLFALRKPGNIYTRITNPTVAVLEERIAALEGGVGALATASGMAAITYAVLGLAHAGDHVVAATTLYGGTFNLLKETLPRYGVTTTFVDADNPEEIEAAIKDNTKLVLIESLGNPLINIPDFEKIAEIAHSHKIPLVADNTFGTPYLINVISHGVDIVVHSATKFIGGHGTTIGVLSSILVNLTGKLQANSHSWLTKTHLTTISAIHVMLVQQHLSLPFVHNFCVTQGLPWHLSMLSCSCKDLKHFHFVSNATSKILKKS